MRTLALAAALALAACNQSTPSTEPEAAPAAVGMMEQTLAMAPEQQPVFAWQQLTAYQTTHPEAQPPCAAIRRAESRGVIPDDAAADSVYAAHKGALVYSIQCGQQLTTSHDEAREHWLVVMAPGAAEAVVVNCANAAGRDQCPRAIPRTAAAATPAQ